MKKINRLSKIMKNTFKFICLLVFICNLVICCSVSAKATTTGGSSNGNSSSVVSDTDNNTGNILGVNISTDGEDGLSGALQIVLVLTVIALCPSILIMLTSFTRIIIVLHFTRAALNTQTEPPNLVLVGLALFLTFFIMSPVFNQVYTDAMTSPCASLTSAMTFIPFLQVAPNRQLKELNASTFSFLNLPEQSRSLTV